MKFTDGNWMMRRGVRAFYPAETHEVDQQAGVLTVYAPTHPIRHRGDTLEGPLLTVRVSSPLADVVRVRITHFTGGVERGPEFPLLDSGDAPATIETDDAAYTLTAGRLSARVRRVGGWGIDFTAGDRALTGSGWRGMGLAEVEGDGPYVHEQLALGVGECVYGLGERFTAFVKNGQAVDIWNKDGGAGSEQAYKNVPFYLTNRGYGVFVNHPGCVSFEVATEKVARAQFSVPGRSLEYLVIYGPTPREVLAKYAALTGMPALPPAWSFGLWLTTSFTTSYDEATVSGVIEKMAECEIPLSVFHFDCFWMREFRWCDFEWDPRTFPEPEAMLARLTARGLRICVWINPYIAQLSPLFEEGRANDYLLKRADGGVWQSDQWQPGMGVVDFTNPRAARWYAAKLTRLLEMGVDCFKTDFGERIPTDVVYADGSDPERMHNYYSYLYNQVVFEALEASRGEAVVFARSATACCQRFPVHWGGDCFSSFESMAASLRGGLSLSLSGFGFWSHDIGGFEGTPPAAVYKRWIAFGLLSTHSRLHGSSSYRVPWLFDDESVDVLRFFTRLKCSLMPYLYGAAVETAHSGVPMMRAMAIEFPDDPACDYLDRQYLLGDALLVAPVFTEDGTVDFYLPAGRWTELLTGREVEGPRWMRETHGFLSVPLWVRAHSAIAIGASDDRPDYEFAQGVTIRLYALDDGRELRAAVPGLDGETRLTVTAVRHGGEYGIEAAGAGDWRVQLVGVEAASVEGGATQRDAEGAIVTPAAGATRVVVGMQ